MEDSKLIDKVQKLLAMANDATVGEEEAAAFMAKAMQMLQEHNMSLLDLEEAEVSVSNPVVSMIWAPPAAGTLWKMGVAFQAAKVYMCQTLTTKAMQIVDGKLKSHDAFIIVGRKASIEVTKSMVEYVFDTGRRMSKEYGNDVRKKHSGVTNAQVKKIRYQFEKGFGLRMIRRFEEMLEGAVGEVGTNLPVLYKHEERENEQFISQNMPGSKVSTKTVVSNTAHSSAGFQKAGEVSLHDQLGSEKGPTQTLPRGQLLLT